MANKNSELENQNMQMSGWVGLAGFLMILAGSFQAVAGLFALFKPEYYLAGPNGSVALSYDQWGWAHLLIGLVLVLSASSLFAGKWWGKFVAITIATLSAIANFSFIWAYPVWSILVIILDCAIIYAVVMHGTNEYE